MPVAFPRRLPPEEPGPADEAPLDFRDFVSPASFWWPDRCDESAWIEHGPFAFWLMAALRPRRVVELGTHRGFSYLCFCQAARVLELPTSCFAIDTWQGDDHAGYYGDAVFETLSAWHDPRYGAFSTLLRSTFEEALRYFEDGSIDLLHIDGLHYYEAVRADFEAWRPKLSDRAVVLMHDTNVRERDFGVHRLWNELAAAYPHFAFVHGHGLGVLGVGSRVPALVRRLFLIEPDAARGAQLRNAYARLGAGVADRRRLEEGAERCAGLDARIATLEAEAEARAEGRAAMELLTNSHAAVLASVERSHAQLVTQLGEQLGATQARLAEQTLEQLRILAELASQRGDTNRISREKNELQDELNATHEVIRQQGEVVRRQGEEIAVLSGLVRAFEASTLWRMTRPMRRLADRFQTSRRGARDPSTSA